jgi:hypothetical protein
MPDGNENKYVYAFYGAKLNKKKRVQKHVMVKIAK